ASSQVGGVTPAPLRRAPRGNPTCPKCPARVGVAGSAVVLASAIQVAGDARCGAPPGSRPAIRRSLCGALPRAAPLVASAIQVAGDAPCGAPPASRPALRRSLCGPLPRAAPLGWRRQRGADQPPGGPT